MKRTNIKIGTRPVLLIREFREQDGGVPDEIHVLPVGEWDHPAYGKIVIDEESIGKFVENFNAGIRRDLPITEGHEVFDEKPAIGWFRELIDKGADGLYTAVEWTEQEKQLLLSKAYKYFSPEFFEVYKDPQTRKKFTNVLIGGALTNKPYFKELEPVVFTEPHIINQFNEPNMDLKEILGKVLATLSDEEKAFVKDHQDEPPMSKRLRLQTCSRMRSRTVIRHPLIQQRRARKAWCKSAPPSLALSGKKQTPGIRLCRSSQQKRLKMKLPSLPSAKQTRAADSCQRARIK